MEATTTSSRGADQNMPEFKVVLLGDKGVGKSTFAKRNQVLSRTVEATLAIPVANLLADHVDLGEYELPALARNILSYLPTPAPKTIAFPGNNIAIHPVVFETSRGPIRFEIWTAPDVWTAPDNGTWSRLLVDADAVIVMYDVASPQTYRNVSGWLRELARARGAGIPAWFGRLARVDRARARADLPIVLVGNKVDLQPAYRPHFFHRKKFLRHYGISARSSRDVEKPLLWLARKFSGWLCFVDRPLSFVPQSRHVDRDSSCLEETKK